MSGLAGPLVGRERELELVEQLLDETCAGDARFLFVAGEPGIGKTRLLAELTGMAKSRGCLALHGSAAEFERELPFGLVVDAVDEYLESLGPGSFQRLAADDLGELAGVFPALRALDPGSDRLAMPADRFRAHRAVCHLLEALAVKQPLVLALDDLHWADGASVELTSHLLRRPPRAEVLLATTFRRGQIGRPLLTAIERGLREAGRQIELGPLPRAEAETLLSGLEAAEVRRLYEASGGNPFYLLELARMGSDSALQLDDTGEDVGVPAAVAAATLEELDNLSAPARRLAEAAAVAGEPFELDLTVAIAGMVEAEALGALDELIAGDLVRSTQVPRRFRFRHPLVRRAVYESCSPGSRIAAHERAARALDAHGAPAHQMAHHVEYSARHGDAAAVALLREAGAATAGRAPVSAARWFRVALRLMPATAPRAERLSLLTDLAGARASTGHFEDSRAALLEGIGLAEEELLRVQLLSSCAGLEQLLGRHEEAHARLIAAVGELSNSSSPQAVELMMQLAVGDFYRMDYAGMLAWGERALEGAETADSRTLIAASTAVLAVAEAFSGAIQSADVYCARAALIVGGLSDEEIAPRLDALANLSTAELYLHRWEEASAYAQRGLAIARATGQGEVPPVLVPVLGAALHRSGRVAQSAELLDGAVEAARLSGNAQALGWNLLSRAYTAVAAGDLELAVELAEESVELTRGLDDSLVSTYANVALADALCESGEAERAAEVLVTAAGGEDLPLIARGWRANYFELLTRCRLELGRTAEAERAAGQASLTAAETGLSLATAMGRRAAAAVALARGAPARAAELALAGVAAADESGARVDAARTRTLAGRALAAAGERDQANTQLEAAARELEACGARRYREEAEHELRKLGRRFHRRTGRLKAGGKGVEALTGRELEVAQLVVDRRTNPEIATALYLSEKTIETHMRNIFRKLGVSSRADVARTLERAQPASPRD